MTAEDNKTLARRLLEGWNKKDPSVFDELIAPGFISHTPDGSFKGPDGYKELYKAYVTGFPDCQFTVDALLGDGDQVSLSYTFHGTHTGPLPDLVPTGKRVAVPGVSVTRFENGQIAEEHVIWDRRTLTSQLGIGT